MSQVDCTIKPCLAKNKPLNRVSDKCTKKVKSVTFFDKDINLPKYDTSWPPIKSEDCENTSSFSAAFENKFACMETALQSLDSLNEQILQFIFATSLSNGTSDVTSDTFRTEGLLPQQRDALHASLTLMRGLLMDAQAKFKKMVDNNRRLANHIDGTIQSANQEVNTLRVELNVTNQKLLELSMVKEVCSHCQDTMQLNKVVEENKSLNGSNRQLQKEIENLKQQVTNSENRNKESMLALTSDRKRLKQEKTELLNQIQEMQNTIDDKEEQLRDFIREFELQMKENEEIMRESDDERSRLTRERNDLSRRLQDQVEIVTSLRGEVVGNEKRLREMESEVLILRTASAQLQGSKRRSFHISVEESYATHNKTLNVSGGTEPNSASQLQDPLLIPASSPTSPRHYLQGQGSGGNSSSSEDVHADVINGGSLGHSYTRRTKIVQNISGSLSRAFRRGKNRKSLDIARPLTSRTFPRNASFSVSSLCSDADVFLTSSQSNLFERSEEEKKETLTTNQNLPMHKWRADAVLVWLELVMHMSQYSKECAENIKSGKVLLGLSESELDKCLNIDNVLHRRKLWLAIEEFRNPAVTVANMSAAGQLDHWWVCEQWLRDVGLTQYASRFREHLIDGRTLHSLSRKDLERHLGMEKKSHQESAMRGIELLRMLAFNTQRLDERRQMCQTRDTDVLVWNNARLIQWAKSVDLKEYSSSLRDSGVHGALLVLDPTFTSDDMANALGIPVNKATVRRHLASEFEALVKPARDSLADEIPYVTDDVAKKMTSLGPSFVRTANRSRKSLRSSISRSLGRQASRDTQFYLGK
ncbi:kazrin isoform X1 [Ciona intestinalis]